jgi:hypothetical protein
LRLGPRWKGANDIVAEQHHQVIAFGKDHQARWRSNRADNVRHSVSVTGDRSNAGPQLGYDGPDQWSRRRLNCRLFSGACRFRLLTSEGNRAQGTAEKSPSFDHA